jgi:hypothetical protein
VLEAEEQALHEAEAMLREALRDEDKRRRIAAAGYLLECGTRLPSLALLGTVGTGVMKVAWTVPDYLSC